MKSSRLAQISNNENRRAERDLRHKIHHLEAEVKLLSSVETAEHSADEVRAKELAIVKFKEELEVFESQKLPARIGYQGRVTIELSPIDGFLFYMDEEGDIDNGKYWSIDWGVRLESDLTDSELQQVMDYYNIDDTTYQIGH